MKSKAFKGSHKHLGEHRRDVEAKIHFRLSVILRLRLRHANPIVCKAFFTQDLHLCGTAKKERKCRNLSDPNQHVQCFLADQLHFRKAIKWQIPVKPANQFFATAPSMRNGLLVALSVAGALAAIASVNAWPIMTVAELQSMVREVRIVSVHSAWSEWKF